MNLKVKAAGIVAGIFIITIAAQGIIALAVEAYGTQTVLNAFVGSVLAFLMYQMYTLVLMRLEGNKKLEEMSKKG